jgi:hypothetical protein
MFPKSRCEKYLGKIFRMYNKLLGTKFEQELFTTLKAQSASAGTATGTSTVRIICGSSRCGFFINHSSFARAGKKGTYTMQDDSRTDSRPRGYAGGKWKQQASSAAEDAKMALGAASGTVKDRARQVAEQQKKVGAEQIGGVARAVHGAAHELEQELPHAAGFIHDAAAKLEGAANSLREHSVDDLIGSLNNFARNQPTAFFGGAVLAGFALSRFLKSSAEPSSERRR